MLVLADAANSNVTSLAEKTFNTILPVLASWVGTVLAFYFSSHSLERTSATLDRYINSGTEPSSSSSTAGDIMRPVQSIHKLIDFSMRKPLEISLKEIREAFDDKGRAVGTQITRLVMLENGLFKHVLHVGTFDAYVAKNQSQSIDLSNTTLETLLRDEQVSAMTRKVAYVAPSASLAATKSALDGVSGAQDVIVTDTGTDKASVRGWITNVNLTRALTVR